MKTNTKKIIKIWDIIHNSKNILLHLHPGPDGDSTGSALSFMFALKHLKKNVTLISGDSSLPPNLLSLPGTDKILNKNLFQIDLKKFDLFLILDASAPNQISNLGEIKFPSNLKTIVIDHHDSNQNFAKINLIDKTSPATCQILYEVYKQGNIKIDKNMALCLFTGMYTDSGGFKYPRTTSKTFEICAELTKITDKFPKTIFEIENNESSDKLKMLALYLSSIENYFKDQVAIASVSQKTLQDSHINLQASESLNVANMLKSVVGWDIGISLIEYQPEKVKVSFRTRKPGIYDVSKIAEAVGTGGGHKAAAGALISKPFDEAKKHLLKTIATIYPELGKI
jgi:phosphoesterase RecJ-like protein